ncbi:ubiquitin carboxyl-terminal hydrolase 24-like [Watersipora subatra]|uniref:ubiquitin carboxyl-terminal hydrolase 24-like n=1 Tax=Watersipora subatra TaxID=2589382 RepID=UPI00355B9B9B
MLKCAHFNAKMNALIEITKMIEDASSEKDKGAVPLECLTQWMADNRLLSIILSGSIDQAQYCEKVKRIVGHVAPHLSKDDLEQLWNRTNDQTNHIVDNIHGIFAAAASQFSPLQFTAFAQLITQNWTQENEDMKHKLISLLGLIGKNAKSNDLGQKVIELLWDLSHREDMMRDMVDTALDEMYVVMVESASIKESYKRKYADRCMESIKKGVWIMPALKQLLCIVKHVVKIATNRVDRSKVLTDIHRNCDINKLIISSLVSSHQLAVKTAGELSVALHSSMLVDTRYTHQEYIELHLECLQFVLQESNTVSLSWNRVKELWECMVNSGDACEWDRNICYVWLTNRINELEPDAACNLFNKKLLTDLSRSDDSLNLSAQGFECWKNFFNFVNLHEHKIKPELLTIEKMDLVGLEELWGLCLNIGDSTIAQEAIDFLLQNVYINLAPKHKRDGASLHRKFITECHRRLEALLISLRGGGSVVFRSLSQALYTLTTPLVPGLEKLPAPLRPKYALNIERLLLLVETYVFIVEEMFDQQRSILPHGSSFYGSALTINCECETRKECFVIMSHRNESLLSFRMQVAEHMNVSLEHIQFNTSELKSSKDQRLMGQLGIEDGHKVIFRLSYLATTNPNLSSQSAAVGAAGDNAANAVPIASSSPCKTGNMELEKNLPGVMIAHESQVFKVLYQLAELAEPRITQRVIALLHLIPTDPAVIATVDNVAAVHAAETESQPSSLTNTPASSPSHSPLKFRHSTGRTYGSNASTLSRKCSSANKIAGLFNQTGMNSRETSPFRVRYNLEVLSSRIMPVDMPSGRSTQFCEDFIACNGLHLILQIFQADYFLPDVEHDVRQACYSLSLQLITYLLCGETVKGLKHFSSLPSTLCIEKMEVGEFSEVVSCMMRVSWAASVGKHHLSNSLPIIRDLSGSGRLRQNSADSSASSCSDTEIMCLQAGICLTQTSVDTIDSRIAVKAFEVLVLCLCARPELIGCFYTLPNVADFLLDVLTGCCREEVRSCACRCLSKLSALSLGPNVQAESPKLFLLKVILQARLPYWVTNCTTRGARQRLLSQCLQYFDLRCELLKQLSPEEKVVLEMNVLSHLEDELAWLGNFQPSCKRGSDASTDDILLTGHLRLVSCLLTCEGVDKERHTALIHTLLDDFLFPAAKLEKCADSRDSLAEFSPKCMVPLTQSAAYNLLIEICKGNPVGLQVLADKLISWHHNTVETTEWEYMPPVEGRSSSGFVGLKNGGATCYMNSVVQQLFMIPGVAHSVLAVDDDIVDMTKTVFHEIQKVFGHLLFSQLQFYEPDDLWHVFKLWGQSVNVREQQDAFDFFTALTDQLDETLKKLGQTKIFEKKFQGVFSDQKNCEECSHKYEREEPFLALNLTVSNPSLEQSLSQFVKGELLEGDNAYFCEKCNLKRNAVKRTCIKSLPSNLCIHLKRFSFDWEANKALKFDDYFKFPLVLDMGPYTIEENSARYELVGIVVHTGQASAGHYYSFIKDRRGSHMSNESHGKWFKFNDTTVEEFDLTPDTIATECFGGRYKAKNTDSSNGKLPEDRVRYWNAYLLFYERIANVRSTGHRRSSRLRLLNRVSQDVQKDSLSELSELVHQGEQQGAFSSAVPGWVQRSTRTGNLQFLRNRNVYSEQYFSFIRKLVSTEANCAKTIKVQVQVALKFVLNTYLRTKETLRGDMDKWYDWLKSAFEKCPKVVEWFIDYIVDDHHTYIVPYLLTCCIKDIREFYLKVLVAATEQYITYLQSSNQPLTSLNRLIETLLLLLNREVIEHSRNAHEYFHFFFRYSKMSTLTCDHLISQDIVSQFVFFLLGKIPEDSTLENLPRRFTTMQTREFGRLHCTVAVLFLHLEFSTHVRTKELLEEERFPVLRLVPNPVLLMSDDVRNILSDHCCQFYIREALIALKEMESNAMLVVVDALVYTAHALPSFSTSLIQQTLQQFVSSPGNELKGLSKLALQLLLLPDEAQKDRMQALISGGADGTLKVIRDSQTLDSQKSYQLIKLLTTASSKSEEVSQYLLSCSSKWQWCVDWLKRRMEENSWLRHSTTSNEDSLSRNFQRTTSAQYTLEKATAMFTSSQASGSSDMEVDSIQSEDQIVAIPDSALTQNDFDC